jgi:hypothetical protein
MKNTEILDTYLNLRINKRRREAFHVKASRYGKPSDILRELIEAFLDDRLVIKPNPRKENLYVRD